MARDASLQSTASTNDARYARRLAAGFGALVALTFALITLGALVRANQAGLACPDWPLCFGEFIPRMDLRIGFEWTHRVVAGGVGIAFVLLCGFSLQRSATRAACGALMGIAALLLAAQVVLGALTVWKLLAAWTVTSHLLTGNAFAVSLLWIALALGECARGAAAPAAVGPGARIAVSAAAALLILQMLLGGLVASRYAGLACPDFPTCRDGIWLPSFAGAVGLQLAHRLVALALVAGLATTAFLCRGEPPRLRRSASLALGLGLLQLGVGAANVLLALPPEVTGLHSALAAALVLSVSVALRESWRAPLRGGAAASALPEGASPGL